MLGLKNKYSKLYEDEMDKYRVKLTDYKDLDDEEIFDFVIGNEKNTDFGDLI